MNTNILALVTVLLTTNVTETITRWENRQWVSDAKPFGTHPFTLEAYGHWEQIGPLEKLLTTTVSRITHLIYEWPAGVPRTNELSEVLTNHYRLFKLEKTEAWRDIGPIELGGTLLSITNSLWIRPAITNVNIFQ